jgi:hypothetical protein
LTEKPLQVTLTAEQKQQVRERIQPLDATKDLSEEDARKTLDGLLTILTDQRKTLEDAGYRWPGQQGGGGNRGQGATPANPFSEGTVGEHLKSLRHRLEAK